MASQTSVPQRPLLPCTLSAHISKISQETLRMCRLYHKPPIHPHPVIFCCASAPEAYANGQPTQSWIHLDKLLATLRAGKAALFAALQAFSRSQSCAAACAPIQMLCCGAIHPSFSLLCWLAGCFSRCPSPLAVQHGLHWVLSELLQFQGLNGAPCEFWQK